MKNFRRVAAIVLTYVMMFTIAPADTVKAATDEFPTTFRVYYWGGNEKNVEISISDHHTYITNVKSKNKALIAKLTEYDYDAVRESNDTYKIAFFAYKKGTYDITYDVMKDSEKVKTVKAKVYVYPQPIDVQLDGVKNGYYGKKTTTKLNVTADKGNTIQKIEVGTYKTTEDKQNTSGLEQVTSEIDYQTVKNNSKINLGTTGYYYKFVRNDSVNDQYNENFNTELMSKTFVRVTYKDKYTKCDEQVTFNFRGLAE